jgi:nitrogen fixation protein FixH
MMRPLTGRGVLVWLAGFFGIIFVTNFIFITMAVKTFSGEDEQKPYLQGVEYNHTLARRAQQAQEGWQATVGGHRLASGFVTIEVTLARPDGSAGQGLSLSAELRHPANENRDHAFRLREVGAGHYRGEITGIPAGQWDIVLVNNGRQPFQASRRLWLS